MTDTFTPATPATPAQPETLNPSPRLERPRDSALKGVCTALARTTGTDVVLWRVLFVVTAFFGGLGVVAYLAGIVVIPLVGEQRSLGERLARGPDRHLTGWQVVLLVALVLSFAGLVNDSDGLIAAAVLGVLGVLWWRGRPSTPPVYGGTAAATPLSSSPLTAEPAWTPPPRRPRSPLGALTVSVAVIVAGVLVLLGATGAAEVSTELVLAASLGVVGLGLVVGAWWGRSILLILLAVLLGMALAITAAVRPAIDAGVGDRTWTPTGSASYRLGVGEATLDLRDVAVRQAATIGVDARVDVGHLLVIVPEGVRVSLDARAELGDLLLVGVDTNGRKVSQHLELGPEGAPQLRLDLSVRTGQVEVRRG